MRAAAYQARSPKPERVRYVPVPAPVGTDAVTPAPEVDARHAFFIINAVAGARGLTSRPGTTEHATNVGLTAGEVRSLMAHTSPNGSVPSRLFAAAQNGIYDVSAGGAAPALKYTFLVQNVSSGFGVTLPFVNAAGDHFLLFADEANGYLLYAESTDSWTQAAMTGVDPKFLSAAVQWNARVWLTERSSSRAWYLAPGAIGGQAAAFDFGPLFAAGGELRGLWRWTRDGGAGMDDFLVAASGGGDLVVFQGTDPLYPNFRRVGAWNVGGFPAGRQLASPFGGDLQVLTLQGLLSMNRLVSGRVLAPDSFDTDSIRPLFIDAAARMSSKLGWHVQSSPGSFLLVNTPGVSGEPQEQFAMSYATRGWSRLQGLDMLSSALWNGEFYFGTRDGRVLRLTGPVDNVKLGGDTSQAREIVCSVLGGFSDLGSNRRKLVRFFRPTFLTHGTDPSFESLVRFDYRADEPSGTMAAAAAPTSGWDVSAWDAAQWGGLSGQTFRRVGVAGCGTMVACGVRFSSRDYCVLTGYQLGVEEGGAL